jgi:formate hydrogenlyase subunit 3/multisubunit Na+/H+ antiporter MnhD subunit
MNGVLYTIVIPMLAGILLFFIPGRIRFVKELISILAVMAALYSSIVLFGTGDKLISVDDALRTGYQAHHNCLLADHGSICFQVDGLSRLIVLFLGIFGLLILVYCLTYNKGRIKGFYSWYLITLGASYGAVLSDNLLLFIIFWGVLGITLYKLIPGTDEASSAAAKKTLIIIGASDGIMILGIAIIWKICGTLSMADVSLPTSGALTAAAFLALLTGSFTKAGAFPFHSWIPDYAQYSPASSAAFLPASLDKLLGIYFLARITTDLFILTDPWRMLLLSLGVITIVAAVLMALVQHNCRRLLGFHAVSQVGYMVLGFSLGSMLGVAAGLFHMLNNVIYKSGLFLTAGNVEFRTGKEDIDELGDLSRSMPLTFFGAIVFALSISGIPPLNGFASKWMIYQAIIDFGSGSGLPNKLWILWLGLAVFGSALTLASFIKFIGGIFLSGKKQEFAQVREVPVLMWAPLILLALGCLLFGIFATGIILPRLLMPVSGVFVPAGFWNSSLVSVLVLISVLLGICLYLITGMKKFRTEDSFIGGEKLYETTGYPVSGFYHTLKEFRLMAWFYQKAEERWFDVYELSKRFTLWLSSLASRAHSGILPHYTVWIIAGLIILLMIMNT